MCVEEKEIQPEVSIGNLPMIDLNIKMGGGGFDALH